MNKNIYKLTFDPETKRWNYSRIPSEEAYEAEVSNPLFDPDDETVAFFDLYSDEEAARIVNRRNRDLAAGSCEMRTCKDCGRIFFLDEKERDWYITREYQLPKRCRPCRVEKKKKTLEKKISNKEVDNGQR